MKNFHGIHNLRLKNDFIIIFINNKMNDILLLLPDYFVSIEDMNNYFQTCKKLSLSVNNITYMLFLTKKLIDNNKDWYNVTKHSIYITNTYYLSMVHKVYKNYNDILGLIPNYETLEKNNYNIDVYYSFGEISSLLKTNSSNKQLEIFDILYITMIKKLLENKYGWSIVVGDVYQRDRKLSECHYNGIIKIYAN